MLITTSTCRTPSAFKAARCSSDCGIQPSVAATTNITGLLGHRTHPGEHVRDEPLVARHVDESELPPVDVGPREAEVDGQAAALLLGQPVGPHAGEPLHERRLAVVDVPGRGYDIHASTARTSASSSSGATVRRSSRHRPPSRRPTTAGVPVRSGAA